jgi:hypothetical protein
VLIEAENRKILNEQQVEKTLIYLLLNDYDDVKIAAAQALAVMSESQASRDSVRTFGIRTFHSLSDRQTD